MLPSSRKQTRTYRSIWGFVAAICTYFSLIRVCVCINYDQKNYGVVFDQPTFSIVETHHFRIMGRHITTLSHAPLSYQNYLCEYGPDYQRVSWNGCACVRLYRADLGLQWGKEERDSQRLPTLSHAHTHTLTSDIDEASPFPIDRGSHWKRVRWRKKK